MHARTPVHLPTRLGDFLNLSGEHLICSAMLTQGSLPPSILAAQRHLKPVTLDAHRIVLASLFNDLGPHSWPCEKMDTVFLAERKAFLDTGCRLKW
jgi:hypothetical protein